MPAIKDPAEYAFPWHDAVSSLVIDGTLFVTFLPNLGYFHPYGFSRLPFFDSQQWKQCVFVEVRSLGFVSILKFYY